ncbi:uncharacterized protein An01g11940 [Aspergillus niger]|uniref:Contig An01c0350, genomic contig n=2 Tax=Aspergillus niger TaxID=5061 RepID=A2QAL4_ASPNC|nr:uncharacterized protein An01g11940 [Aspergillus niger]CAK44095.1 unnamed protein product [Aspergillus niger]
MNVQWMLESRGIFSDIPPDPRTKEQNNPTLLVSWWATAFSVAIIVVRVCGRYIRTERFFREDKVMMLSVIPLLIRMACVHVVLIWGTNNTKTVGLSAEDIHHRVIGTTLAECQPFDHYWQVVPDPGPRCRLGYANLITMGSCDVMTDLLLVSFPIPFIVMTHMPLKRKISLVILFALSLILVGITCYRVPSVIWNDGSQQYRSLVASLEILAATAVSNAVIIGSFVRDRGAKKNKFKKAQGSASVSESMDHSSVRRQTITHHQWGSDSDLAADLGIRLDPSLCSADTKTPRPAPIAMPIHPLTARAGTLDPNWSFNQRSGGSEDDQASSTGSLDIKVSPHEYIETNKTPRKSSSTDTTNLRIFDVGSLLNNHPPTSPTSAPTPQYSHYASGASNAFVQDTGGPARTLHLNTTSSSIPSHQVPLSSSPNFSRPGGLRSNSHSSSNRRRGSSVHFSDPPDSPVPSYRSQADVSAPIMEGNEVELQDVGRLLSRR